MADENAPTPEDLASLRAELSLYKDLLGLANEEQLEGCLRHALGLLVRVANARLGYLEVRTADHGASPDFWFGHARSPEEEASFRSTISQGVIAEAMASGRTVVSASALDDPRFRDRGSVRQNKIDAILCSPIGTDPLGVVYLQGRASNGPFTAADREHVETVCRHIAPYVDRLLLRDRAAGPDPTASHRGTLQGADALVGRSAAIGKVLEQVALVARYDVCVLVTGATGTGKSLVARILHQNSPRSGQPLVEINCGALPEALVENELFGAAPGAHSTATAAITGKVAAAEGGTLFLDEIGELPASAQSKLLQLLQSGEYYPLGAPRPRLANVRIVAATNRNLEQAVGRREFREDLFYRLNVLPIRMPGLEERTEDLPLLAAALCQRACRANRLPELLLSPAAVHAIETADWPGHVRQVENMLAGAVLRAVSEGCTAVEVRHVFPTQAPSAAERPEGSYQEQMSQFRNRLVARTLDETSWNVSEAARRLDVRRSYLHKLIRAADLRRKE